MTAACALLVVAAVWLAAPAVPEPRLGRLFPGPSPSTTRSPGGSPRTMSWLAAALAAVGGFLVFGGAVGLVLAVACLAVVPRVAGSLETRADRQHRDALARQGPALADLLAATVAAGSHMAAALASVSDAIGEPARSAVQPVRAALDLGADAETAWQALADDPVLGAMCAAVVRSARTGAPLAAMLARIADDLRRERRIAVEVAAQAAGVRAVVPLAACFLPAFLLLGVVPVVAALATGLLSGS